MLAIFLTLLCGSALASREGYLVFDSFTVSSGGVGESGNVIVSGKQSDKGITELTVTAFGKTIDVPVDKLTEIGVIAANQIHISYEYGYHGLEGQTIYLRLTHGSVSGSKVGKIIKIKANGKISIGQVLSSD